MPAAPTPKTINLTEASKPAPPEDAAKENKEAKPAKPAESKPQTAKAQSEMTDAELMAEVARRGLAKTAPKGKKLVIEVPIDVDDDSLSWSPRRIGPHIFLVAAAPKGGYFVKPESFVGDVKKVDDLAECEEFASWPNSKAKIFR